MPPSPRLTPRLGRLELAVLERLWEVDEASVGAMTERVGAGRRRAPSTIHSTLERLVRKGLALREKRGRAYLYRAALTRETFLGQALEALLARVPGAKPRELFATFVSLAERAGGDTLDELDALVREARRRERAG